MTNIKAEVVADSLSPQGDRLTSLLITFPRIILAEVNTHRMLSKNTSSSRAIPFEKIVEAVQSDPFIPIVWQKDHKGMQGNEYFTGVDVETNNKVWLQARDNAIRDAILMNRNKVTKQLCNRLLEPFMWTTMLITGSKEGWDNFFKLRCPQYEVPYTWDEVTKVFKSRKDATKYWQDKADIDPSIGKPKDRSDLEWFEINKGQAEIHMMALSEAMYDAINESTPKLLKEGEWHIPFGDQMDEDKIETLLHGPYRASYVRKEGDVQQAKIEIATARCARLSYMTFDGEIDYEKDLKLHDTLLKSHHMSPFEHCARAMSDKEYYSFLKGKFCPIETSDDWYLESFLSTEKDNCGWCRNFKGFIPYRYMIENSI